MYLDGLVAVMVLQQKVPADAKAEFLVTTAAEVKAKA